MTHAKRKTYEVIGDSLVDGHEKGETFIASYSPVYEAALIQGGHIKVVTAKDADASKTEGGK